MSSPQIPEDSFSSDTDFDDESASESSTDVEAKLAREEIFDKEFFRCYSALKKNDEKIYDKNIKFFNESTTQASKVVKEETETNKSSSSAPRMTLLDHQLALKSDEPDQPKKLLPKSFYEQELHDIKETILKTAQESDSDEEFLVSKSKTSIESTGKTEEVEKPKEKVEPTLWGNTENLTDDEKFLRDYILNKRYINGYDDTNHFSKNIDELSDVESEEGIEKSGRKADFHSQEDNFHELKRIPRNSTKTIRDLVEKRKKKEKRLKRIEKLKKRKKALKDADCEDIVGDLPTKFPYQETEPVDYGMTAEEILLAPEEELDERLGGSSKSSLGKKRRRGKNQEVEPSPEGSEKKKKKRKRKKRGTNHKKVGVAPDRLLSYGLSKNKLKKASLL